MSEVTEKDLANMARDWGAADFMDDVDEWHAFVLGWCREMNGDKYGRTGTRNTIAAWWLYDLIQRERWYYEFGRVVGTWMRRGLKLGAALFVARLLFRRLK